VLRFSRVRRARPPNWALPVALTTEPDLVLDPLTKRMHRLAEAERFEEAAATRDRIDALARAMERRRTVEMWRRVPRAVFDIDGWRLELRYGRLLLDDDDPGEHRTPDAGRAPTSAEVAEILAIARWLQRNAARVRLVAADDRLASPLGYGIGEPTPPVPADVRRPRSRAIA